MLIKNSQQDIVIDLPADVKTVGLKISGGVDSAITGYILTKYIHEERPDIKIQPMTVNQVGKAYQIKFAKHIIEFYKKEFGNYFLEHITGISKVEETDYIAEQDKLMTELYKNKIIQVHFIGLTKNPPPGLLQANYGIEPPDRIRQDELHPVKSYRSYRPLVNIDKKGVAELYDILGVRDTLFPLTRSCSAYTEDFTYHCGQCWFCAERFYGFKKY
jgi:hypothetical protein